MRLIPGKTKVKIELFKGVSLTDLAIGLIGIVLIVFVLTSTFPWKFGLTIGITVLTAGLIFRLDIEPNYVYLLYILRFFSIPHLYGKKQKASETTVKANEPDTGSTAEADETDTETVTETEEKKAKDKPTPDTKGKDIRSIIGFTDIKDDFIVYDNQYYGAAIEISPVEFRFFSQHRRNYSIENCLGRVLRSLPSEYSANIVKLERPIIYDEYLEVERKKADTLRASYEGGAITEEELQTRLEIVFNRIYELKSLCNENKVVDSFFYLVLYDSDRSQLNNQVNSALDLLTSGEMKVRRLNSKELAVFLRYSYELDFDEREIENVAPENYASWAMPRKITLSPRKVLTNGIISHNFRVASYPSQVGDAWLASVMSLPGTKVVVKCKPMDREKAVRSIDRSLQELRGQLLATGVDSRRLELQEHVDTLSELLATLRCDNETLLDVNIYITAYDIHSTRLWEGKKGEELKSILPSVTSMKRVVRRTYQEAGIKLNAMEFDQLNAFIGSQVSAYDPHEKDGRGLPSNSLAACYPWIFSHVNDKNGFKMGESEGIPVFMDFFRRDNERVNSNMVIVGKSGSGKSFATKSLLTNLAADDSKIFILDPENEYTDLARNLNGKFINVGNGKQGRMNPFHVITGLSDDETGEGVDSGCYASHLQFLEEFFHQILPDCDKEAMEYLNSLIDRMYTDKGITAETDFRSLTPGDYPTFDDLYDTVLAEFQTIDNEYIHSILRTLLNYVSKFAAGGRNANLWNGPSTITTDENFTVFNFQSLLANRNGSVANAQMLLVLKYIDNEIIKNRDYNILHKANRKIVVVIDEAHVFIDTKYPVALDFMFQLAKRIRKYNGMQIVITQNIKDFVGSEEIARKSTAIINACQYSFIFALAPNDMEDLCKLYEKAGGINENEQEEIISAPRGQAFTVLSPSSRSTVKIRVTPEVQAVFGNDEYLSQYFAGEDGKKKWEEYLGESRMAHEKAVADWKKKEPEQAEEEIGSSSVSFAEFSEEDFRVTEAQRNVTVKEPKEKKKAETKKCEEEPESVGFAEIPEVPEPVTLQQPAAVQQPVMVQQPAAVQQPVMVQQPAPVSEAQIQIGFRYEDIVREIRRSVREEMEQELAKRLSEKEETEKTKKSGIESAVQKTEEESEAKHDTGIRESATESDVSDNYAESLFGEEDNRAEASGYNSDESGFDREDTDVQTAPASDTESEEETPFDFMSMYLEAASKRKNTDSPIDDMIENGETSREITLDDLMKYLADHE